MAVREVLVAAPTESSGYRRLVAGDAENAVAWWYVARFSDGHVFARGGRCRTSKLARTLIHRVAVEAKREHADVLDSVPSGGYARSAS